MNHSYFKKLQQELDELPWVRSLHGIMYGQCKKETYDHINEEFIFSENYIELFELYLDLYCCSFIQQLPFKIIEKLIGQIKQCPTLHHNYLILKILEQNFNLDQYTIIINDIAQSQKLLGLCVILTNKKIKQITKQILKVIIPIIYQLPVYQISFHGIIEQYIEQQRQIQKIDDQWLFLLIIVEPNLEYFKKFHIESIFDCCFYFSLQKKNVFNKSNLYQLQLITQKFIAKIANNNNLFQKNEKYFKEINNCLKSNDPLTIRICLEFYRWYDFENRDCVLISDQQILKTFMKNINEYTYESCMIIELWRKILIEDRSQVERLLLNKEYQDFLVDELESEKSSLLTTLRILDLDITKKLRKEIFFEKWFRI